MAADCQDGNRRFTLFERRFARKPRRASRRGAHKTFAMAERPAVPFTDTMNFLRLQVGFVDYGFSDADSDQGFVSRANNSHRRFL